jgi:AraC family transcriptional regulator, transcriptional activator FtrA
VIRQLRRRDTMSTVSAPFRFLRRVLVRPLVYVAGFLVLPLLIGGASLGVKMSNASAGAPPPYTQPMPAAPDHDPSKRTAVVLSSAYGAEITDFLPPYEILARSGAFNVYAVAPERKVLPLVNSNMQATSLDFVPHYSFEEYAATIGRAPDLIAVPWFPGYTAERDAALLDWIRANAGPNTTLLTICAGTEILADTGLMAGHTATTNTGWFGKLQARHPEVNWVRNVRYYDDGRVITSSNLATGIDATLRAVDRLAGRDVALDVARQLGYPATRYLDDPSFQSSMASLIPVATNAAYQLGREEMGVLLYEGVSELAVAGLLDLYSSSYVARPSVFAADTSAVRSRNGITFIPRDDFRSVGNLDRVVLPGGDATGAMQQAVTAWNQLRPERPVQEIHRSVGAGESAYDATLRDMARTQSAVAARGIGQTLFYPTEHIQFDSAGWPVAPVFAPLALSLLGLAAVYMIRRPRNQPAAVERRIPRAA